MDSELSLRQRGQKLNTSKLSALEKLKRIRQGEKIEDEEEVEEEAYEYIEEDDDFDDQDDYTSSKKKSNKNSDNSASNSKSKPHVKRHLTREKTSADNKDDSVFSSSTDIRTAFFKAASKPSNHENKSATKQANADDDDNDDLANEIMRELNQKKKTPAPIRPTASPSLHNNYNKPKHVPFSINSAALSLSPAHKRKLSPLSANGMASNNDENTNRCSKKRFELENVEMASPTTTACLNPNTLADVSNTAATASLAQVKSEPQDFDDIDDISLINSLDSMVSIKKEKQNHHSTSAISDQEAFENMELLSQLNEMNLETISCTSRIKQEAAAADSTMDSPASTAAMNQTTDFVDLKQLNASNQEKMVFYWLDAFEDAYNSSGSIYLFGKTPFLKKDQQQQQQQQQLQFVSVCCVIKNIPKTIYVLPRKDVQMEAVCKEITTLMNKNKISQFRTRTVKKYYAFDKHLGVNQDQTIPYEADYLQVEYQPTQQSNKLTNDMEGESFACIFGAQTPCLEQFLIELRIKGPCWLQVTKPVSNTASVSWSKLEYSVDNYRNVSIYRESCVPDEPHLILPSTPPLTILTLLTRTMLNTKTQEHEIVCACGLVSTKFSLDKSTMPSTVKASAQSPQVYESYFCALTKPSSGTFPYDLQQTIKAYQNKFKIELCGSERALLAFLLCKIQSLDVDILIGHDLFGFNLDIILNRCLNKKVPHWSRMGRLKRSQMPNSNLNNMKSTNNGATNNLIIQQRVQTVCAGRLLCDVMLSAKELITKCKSYDLHDLTQHILYRGEPQQTLLERNLDEEKQVANYYNSSFLLMKYLGHAMTDATYIMKMCNDMQCLQLAYQITCIAGNVLSRTLVGGRSERNEFLLLHAFHDKDFILPDKYRMKKAAAVQAKKSSGKPIKVELKLELEDEEEEDLLLSKMNLTANNTLTSNETNVTAADENDIAFKTKSGKQAVIGYTGGLVLEPKVGYYDRFILLLDFNSLYPSIIQEYNICFTTINRPVNELADTDMDEYLDTCIKLPGSDEKPGILPLEIRKLVDSRRQVKQLMQDKNLSIDLRMQYDIRQKALKLTANSVYGCLGFENSRFYCKPLAALITKNGRSILMKTKELVENKKIEVIYGDTDSIMINTNLVDYDGVIKLGNMLKTEVNKLYKHLEIDIDGVFKSLLLLRKKKYAALTVASRNPKDPTQFVYQKEMKGLDIVRRDWCLLAKQIGEKVLNEILSGQSCDNVLTNINKILNETADKIKNNSFDLKLFEISKQLNRNPEDYGDANHQSHVIVALRHNNDSSNNKKYKSGNVIAYVICEDGTTNSSTQRAYSTSELLKTPEKLQLDYKYYLTQQIHPVVTRLCEPIDGIDAFYVAQSLGLDPAGFKHKNSNSGSNSNTNVNLAVPQSKQQKKLENYMNEIEKYTNCVPFKYLCPECKSETVWQTPFQKKEANQIKAEPMDEDENDNDVQDITIDGIIIKSSKIPGASSSNVSSSSNSFKCILDSCSNSACKMKPLNKITYIKNCLSNQLNKYIKQYYQAWLVCEDPMCSYRTKRISCKFFNGKPQCIECERYATALEYSHSDLYYQMKFFKFIFDAETYKNFYKDDAAEVTNLLRSNKELNSGLSQLKEFVNKSLRINSFGLVSLNELFRRI